MNDKIGELVARCRYWTERAAHHTNRDAALRCAARADLLKRAIEDELAHALGRGGASTREFEVADSNLRAQWDDIDLTKLARTLDTMRRVTQFGNGAEVNGFMRSDVQLELPLLLST
jgi:hypothetical protein